METLLLLVISVIFVFLTYTDKYKCLTDLCNTLMFINANTDAYLGYSGWSAGGFSATDYNLTETPIGSAGNFTDQPIVTQCIVGTRTGSGIASKKRSERRSTKRSFAT